MRDLTHKLFRILEDHDLWGSVEKDNLALALDLIGVLEEAHYLGVCKMHDRVAEAMGQPWMPEEREALERR